jgi:hypothetical protein
MTRIESGATLKRNVRRQRVDDSALKANCVTAEDAKNSTKFVKETESSSHHLRAS